MQIVKGNVWTYPAHVVCIPTNGFIKRDGKGVMGAGTAKQARDRYRYIRLETILGRELRDKGNHVTYLMPWLLTFPVKHRWSEPADLDLIRQSAQELTDLQDSSLTYVLPRPGCGNGQLKWEDVRPIIESILPDNIHVIDFK